MEQDESHELLTTSECAELLRRSEQTLRVWAMNESGPIQPVRTKKGAPLLWRRRDIESLICGTMNENTNPQKIDSTMLFNKRKNEENNG